MKKTGVATYLVLIFMAFAMLQCYSGKNQKASIENTDWEWLYNGTSMNAWKSKKSDKFKDKGWRIDENELTVLAATDSTPAGHDITTKKKYSDFELQLEVKLTKGANSGIKYYVSDDFPGYEGKYLGLEYQLIDDERHADAKLGRDGNRTLASLYDLIPASGDKKVFPPGQWNQIKIIADGNHVEHWLNGVKVLEYNRDNFQFRELIESSKYKDYENFGLQSEGHILIQGHKDEVAFRNIKIRTLKNNSKK